jgi:hypothetical protein
MRRSGRGGSSSNQTNRYARGCIAQFSPVLIRYTGERDACQADERRIDGARHSRGVATRRAPQLARDREGRKESELDHGGHQRVDGGPQRAELDPLGADDARLGEPQPVLPRTGGGGGGHEATFVSVRVVVAWYSTESCVSSMKASSREADCGESSCSTICRSAAAWPISSMRRPVTYRAPSRAR